MPILPAGPDMYPPDLWEGGLSVADPDRRWRCLHTRPRQEKAIARQLYSRQVPHYLPQVVRESRTPSGRPIRSVVPLFAGYLFLHADAHQRLEALKGSRLIRVLEVDDQESLARDLHQVHKMLASGLPVLPELTHPAGTRVRILGGPLQGIVGTVVRRGQRDQFVAVVKFLGRGATVDLQDWQVERVEG